MRKQVWKCLDKDAKIRVPLIWFELLLNSGSGRTEHETALKKQNFFYQGQTDGKIKKMHLERAGNDANFGRLSDVNQPPIAIRLTVEAVFTV